MFMGKNRKGGENPDPLHRPVQIPLLRVLLHHVHVNDQSLKIGKSLFCWKNCQTPIPCSPAWERSTSLICYLWNLGKYKWLSLFSDTTVFTFNFRKIMRCRLFWWCCCHLSVDFFITCPWIFYHLSVACLHSKGFDFKQDIPAVQLSWKKIDAQMMFTGGDNDVVVIMVLWW